MQLSFFPLAAASSSSSFSSLEAISIATDDRATARRGNTKRRTQDGTYPKKSKFGLVRTTSQHPSLTTPNLRWKHSLQRAFFLCRSQQIAPTLKACRPWLTTRPNRNNTDPSPPPVNQQDQQQQVWIFLLDHIVVYWCHTHAALYLHHNRRWSEPPRPMHFLPPTPLLSHRQRRVV